jgi:hypothetical protein
LNEGYIQASINIWLVVIPPEGSTSRTALGYNTVRAAQAAQALPRFRQAPDFLLSIIESMTYVIKHLSLQALKVA